MKPRHRVNKTSRKIHDQIALWTAIPVALIIATGILLQVRKEFDWIQPPTQTGQPYELNLTPSQILDIAKGSQQAAIQSWKDIDRLDIRPKKGIVKIRSKNRWELQVHMGTGEILQEAYRRSDLIESIHDGSFFHQYARLGLFLPAALLLFLLWGTGVLIFLVTRLNRTRRAHSN